ncbi:PREDICTED: uncharacterized protein LOC108778486 [Cyphomyrmex costatus]|uniref:uncharacterized protein LOC108778486 n=1 Tax=Cyphomyrmex costatus TaxID=456900 RepID=UPI0008524261|nr:PREDICTED: uncharacterized protein LOC108778486 [Cyphomyrmex costatus]
MLRRVFRKTCRYSFRHLNERKKHDSKTDQASFGDIACETEYYYKQDRKLLKVVMEKTQNEVKHMQREVQIMKNKIDEYNRDISENLRFLKNLEKDLSAGDKKT